MPTRVASEINNAYFLSSETMQFIRVLLTHRANPRGTKMIRWTTTLAVMALAATLPAGCCDETEPDAPVPVPSADRTTATPAPPAVPTPPAVPAEKTPTPEPSAEEPLAKPDGEEDFGENPSDDPFFGKSPEEVEALTAEQDAKRNEFAKAIGVEVGEGQWEVEYAAADSNTTLVLAVQEDTPGGVPSFKAGLVRDGKMLAATTDFAAFTGATKAQLDARRDCAHWGGEARKSIDLGNGTQAFRVAFWCQKKDGSGNELVTVVSVPATAASMGDLKNLWTGDGGAFSLADGDCNVSTVANFIVEEGQLVRSYTVTANPGGPPTEGDAPPRECPTPQAPEAERFPLAL
jgi:hypothetical protein